MAEDEPVHTSATERICTCDWIGEGAFPHRAWCELERCYDRDRERTAPLIEAIEKAATVAFKGPHDTDAGCLLRAARNLDGGFDVGGSNVRAC